MKKLLYVLLAVGLFSCESSSPEYTKINQLVDFKYVQFGEGKSPEIGDYIGVYLSVTDTLGDTMHYVPNYPYFIKLGKSALDSAWQRAKVGDSISFRLPRVELNRFYKFYKVMESDLGQILMNVRLNAIYDSSEMELAKQEALSKRELDEQRALRNYLAQIDEKLDTLDGAYRIIEYTHDSITNLIQYGSEVSIHYIGSFLNGYEFDNTYQKGITPTFIYGKEYQLIEGMKMGINGLKRGERVKIILPSRRAFGDEGSLAGIVPPYTAVIFNVEIIKVIN